MRVILRVSAGPDAGRQIVISRGLVVQFGNTDWADQQLSDSTMASVQFAVDYTGRAPVVQHRAADSEVPTLLNGEPVVAAELSAGDTLSAGQTSLAILMQAADGGINAGTSEPPPSEALEPEQEPDQESTSQHFCQHLRLPEEVTALAEDHPDPAEFVSVLRQDGLLLPALQVVAMWLGKRQAVGWICQSLRQTVAGGTLAFSSEESEALDAAWKWACQPDLADAQPTARVCEKFAKDLKFRGPAAVVAAAAFWGGQTLGPPELDPIPPDPHLTGKGVAAAWAVVASQLSTAQKEAFLETGLKLTAQPDWPQKESVPRSQS